MERPLSNGMKSNFSRSKKVGSNASNILISLMKEVNLNHRLQNEVLQYAEAGKPIPYFPKDIVTPHSVKNTAQKQPICIKLPPKPIQRSRRQIEQSGVYNIEKYRPNPSKSRSSREKERFQNIMAFGDDIDKDRVSLLKEKKIEHSDSLDLFDEILLEIKERKEFIDEMRELGLAKKYLPEIQGQISVRLKELEKLDELRAQKITSEL